MSFTEGRTCKEFISQKTRNGLGGSFSAKCRAIDLSLSFRMCAVNYVVFQTKAIVKKVDRATFCSE